MKHLIKSNGQYFTLDEHGNPQETTIQNIESQGVEDLGTWIRETSTRVVAMSHERQLGSGHEHRASVVQKQLLKVKQLPIIDYMKVALGALYYDGTELVRPTRPWRDNIAFDGEYGNIPAFHGDMSKYSFGPATSEETVLYWHKFIDYEQNKTLLICDRNLIRSISWYHLNGAGFIFGKEIELDGQRYKCRVLTGGSKNRGGDGYAGGQLPNEWDCYVMNGADVGEPHFAYAPTPVPEDYPSTSIFNDQTAWARAHNQAWNWIAMNSWCRETDDTNSTYRVSRGNHSARHWYAYQLTYVGTLYGWRPVLELL